MGDISKTSRNIKTMVKAKSHLLNIFCFTKDIDVWNLNNYTEGNGSKNIITFLSFMRND